MADHDSRGDADRTRTSWRRFLRQSAYAAVIRVAGLACVFGMQILLARLVGDTAEYGRYAWGQALLFMVGTAAGLGLPTVLARFVAALAAQKNFDAAAAIVRNGQWLLLRGAGACALVAVVLLIYWRGALDLGAYRDVAIVALFCAPLVTFATLYRDISRARRWMVLAMLPLQVTRPLTTAALATLCWWLLGDNLDGVAVLALVGASLLIILLPQMWQYHRLQGRLPRGGGSAGDEYAPARLQATAWPIFFTQCATLVIKYANVLLVGALAGPAGAALYFAAERLAQLTEIPKNVVSSVNQQRMAAAHATGRASELQLLATQSVQGSFWPTLAASLFLVALAGPLLQLFGEDFAEARGVLAILIIGGIVNVFTGPAQDLLVMTGRQRYVPRVMIVSAVAHVAALLVLVPLLGAIGAAVATLTSGLIGRSWLMLLARRETGVDTTVLAGLRRRGRR